MSGEDRAAMFFGSNISGMEAFNKLKSFLDEVCPDVRICLQDSLLAFKSIAGFAYVSLPSQNDSSMLFNLAFTTRKKITSSRISKAVQPIPGTPAYVYHIGIKSEQDIDNEIKAWVRQSYEYSKLRFA